MDKFVRGVLGWIGTILFDIPRFIGKYMLGLIWTGYNVIRRKDFKKTFVVLNCHAKNEIKWIVDEFIHYL